MFQRRPLPSRNGFRLRPNTHRVGKKRQERGRTCVHALICFQAAEPNAQDFFFFGAAFFLVALAAVFFALGVLSPKTVPHCSVNFLLGPERTIGPDISIKLLLRGHDNEPLTGFDSKRHFAQLKAWGAYRIN